ncbi:hypothetical protein Syun_015064 [Stephania yunnanensis]|uniref:Uncharacterized protein n=1 Tax=Stephania yunnanensis TaxID=152371 RepID=A0AAP0JKU7_9MAGN
MTSTKLFFAMDCSRRRREAYAMAMVHKLIGIEDNKVDLKHLGKSPKDQQEVVLSSEQDACF